MSNLLVTIGFKIKVTLQKKEENTLLENEPTEECCAAAKYPTKFWSA